MPNFFILLRNSGIFHWLIIVEGKCARGAFKTYNNIIVLEVPFKPIINVSTIVNRSNFMTKRMFLTSFAVLALLATASMVMAQPPAGGQRGQGGQGGQGRQAGAPGGQVGQIPGGGFNQGGAMGILAIAEARTALGVTDDQMAKLRPAAPATGAAPAANLTAEERAARTAERAAAARKTLEETLTKDQVTKLDIMVFQRAGGLNSLNPPAPTTGNANAPRGGGAGFGGAQVTLDSLRALSLTADQTKKFEEAQAALRAATPQRAPGGNAGPPAAPTAEETAARQKANADFRAAVSALLTAAQKAKSEELMKDVPTYLRPQTRTPGAGGAGAGAGAGNRGAGGAGAGTGGGARGNRGAGAGN